MKLLLFTGAGTSAELGVPAMQIMARQFIDHLHDIDLEPSIVDKVKRLISDAGNDMEHAIDAIDKVEGGMLARRHLGETVATDWYHGAAYETFKLRHPMLLYGPLELISKRAGDLPLHSALVLPSREKTVTMPPFPRVER